MLNRKKQFFVRVVDFPKSNETPIYASSAENAARLYVWNVDWDDGIEEVPVVVRSKNIEEHFTIEI